jgi:two-component system OmpR family sensor kinase
MSLRTKLILIFGLLSASLVLGAASTASTASYESLIDQVDERLYSLTTEVLEEKDAFGPTAEPDDGVNVARIDLAADGSVVTAWPSGVSSAPDALPVLPDDVMTRDRAPVTVDSTDSTRQYRLTAIGRGDGTVTVLAVSLEQVDTAMGKIGLALLFGGTIALVLGGALAAFFIRRETRKLDIVAATADAFAVGDFATRAPVREDASEVGRVVVALNSMLDRVESSMHQEHEAKERLRAFIDDVSHELRTPVTTIQGYAELYEQGGLPSASAVSHAMDRIQQESARMAILIEELLSLARMDMVRLPQRLPVDLSALAESVVSDARVTMPERSLSFSGPDALILLGDRDRLRQALSNLVQNAVTHTPDDTRIEVTTSAEGDSVVVEVHDDAGLIPPEHLSRIFDRTWRGDESGTSHGLGLSIVRRIVDEHGGAIETSSSPESGTRFRLVLPRSLPLDLAPPPPPQAIMAPMSLPAGTSTETSADTSADTSGGTSAVAATPSAAPLP